MAFPAGIDHAADADDVAFFELGDIVTSRGNATDDLVARYHWVFSVPKVIGGKMDIGMAHTAIENLDGNIIRAWFAPIDGYRRKV